MAHLRMKKIEVEIPENVVDDLEKHSGKSAAEIIKEIILEHHEALHEPNK